ncbi:MAG: arginine--tRNA ligase [Oscillospiraceae bacterium]|nr:arginine--tRNA ligase [Oscillospiraceae bacterium]
MLGPISQAKEELFALIAAAMKKAMAEGALPEADVLPNFVVECPADTSHGDFATNAAMAGARTFRRAPAQIAKAIVDNLELEGTSFKKAEIAGPGFINFFVDEKWFAGIVGRVLSDGASYGRTDYGKNEKVMVEFVSANPTGPMHMGNARGGAIGDGLAAALDWAGYDVSREFYINDAGNQIAKFGNSLEARYLQHFKGEEAVPFPEDGYHGADITAHAENYIAENGDKLLNVDGEERRQALVDYALPKNIAKMKSDLGLYRINFDVWYHESELHNSGAVKACVDELSERGLTYEKDGAIWYKNAEVTAERLRKQGKSEKQIEALELKDDVLIRANGFPTYFAADIAYHRNKFVDRGFSKVINIWGADHHGHVARLQGAMDAIGVGGDRLDIVLMQLVRLTRGGEPVRMSKRTGNAITLTDLLEEIPIDAARFFFNMREPGSALDFDLDLAVSQTSENPVYYVQYAHARICSILKNLAAEGISLDTASADELLRLSDPNEVELIRELASFPEEIVMAAKNYDPARVTHYAVELANRFHRFYNACRVKVEDEALMRARVTLCLAVKQTLKNVLEMLSIESPETM